MFASCSCRNDETAAMIPGRSGHDTSSRPMSGVRLCLVTPGNLPANITPMSTEVVSGRGRRMSAVMRQEETVTPLELFFDLVFVLGLTQCTALMAEQPTWAGLAKGLLVLAVMWWSWVGYAWLTSVIDPEEGGVRVAMFAAMAAFLVAGLCIPGAFDEDALVFALAYGAMRVAHIALFLLASRDDPLFRTSVVGLGVSTALGVGLLLAAAGADGALQGGLWCLAIAFDTIGPFFFGAAGWKLAPHHFAERHGLIIIIALGESIVAIGAGVTGTVDLGIVAAAVLGTAIAAALWWLYFDVVALVSAKRLAEAEVGQEQNEMARDSWSYLHFPMVAGIVLVALGMKKTLGHVEEPLKLVPAAALLGGAALYLFGHVGFRLRNIHTLNSRRLGLAIVLLLCVPAVYELKVPALATVALLAVALCALIAYETHAYGEARTRIRNELRHEGG
jgi:low temperature requirement protein LtrA